MKKLLAILLLALSLPALAATEVAGVKFDDQTRVGSGETVVNGAGLRKKAFFKVYAMALYLPAKHGEAEAVLLCGRCTCKAEAEEAARATAVTEIEPPPRIASRSVRYEAVMRRSDEINAGTDDPPPTRPSERTATRTT